MAMKCLDDALSAATVAHRLANQPNDPLQGCLTDELAGPHLGAQFVSRDDPVSMLQEIETHPEYFDP
jgi:hypothetical protein